MTGYNCSVTLLLCVYFLYNKNSLVPSIPPPSPPDLGLFPELRHLQRKSGLTCDVSRTTTRTIPFPRGGGGGEGGGGGRAFLPYSVGDNTVTHKIYVFSACRWILRAKVGTTNFFSPQIANPHLLGLSPQSQLRCASRKIATLHICNDYSANLQGKKQRFWSISALVCLWYFFYLRKYSLDYKMPCYSVSKLSQRSSLNLNETF